MAVGSRFGSAVGTVAGFSGSSSWGTVLEYDKALDGHVADLVAKTSPEGRRWEFGYDDVGNLASVTDPAGVATTDVPDDFTTQYSYHRRGMLDTVTDANGNTTSYSTYAAVGMPTKMVDAFGNVTRTYYDDRGMSPASTMPTTR